MSINCLTERSTSIWERGWTRFVVVMENSLFWQLLGPPR